ncbi:hypothetical protein [Celeribacter sp.]|uniref:hypothetical protein n=1 Tax=Celeribacter sp. TaxID=1890673 RepID=UPI003A93A4E3
MFFVGIEEPLQHNEVLDLGLPDALQTDCSVRTVNDTPLQLNRYTFFQKKGHDREIVDQLKWDVFQSLYETLTAAFFWNRKRNPMSDIPALVLAKRFEKEGWAVQEVEGIFSATSVVDFPTLSQMESIPHDHCEWIGVASDQPIPSKHLILSRSYWKLLVHATRPPDRETLERLATRKVGLLHAPAFEWRKRSFVFVTPKRLHFDELSKKYAFEKFFTGADAYQTLLYAP